MFEHYFAVIMAGGSGTRLWPLSRKDRPKQSLVVSGELTLFQNAVNRLQGLFPPERILVVTVAEQVALLSSECPQIPEENFVIEPLPRGTASVVALAATAIKARDDQAVMAVLTADHLIENEAHLKKLLKAAYGAALTDHLVTLGIRPSYAATGFGYIQAGEKIDTFEGLDAFLVQKFKEKPDQINAERMFSDGEHYWNSGMFIWQVKTVMSEIARQMPDLFEKISKIDRVWGMEFQNAILSDIWPTIKPQTIDYGIMEDAHKVCIIPAENLGWYDVGSWESIFDALERDSSGNILMRGETIAIDTQGTLICEDSSDRMIVTIGVKDLVIIDSGNALLICDRNQTQRVREIVRYLEDQGRMNYL